MVMEDLRNYIDQNVAQATERGELVDVYALAQKVQSTFPAYELTRIAMLVSEAVVRKKGNAEWFKETG